MARRFFWREKAVSNILGERTPKHAARRMASDMIGASIDYSTIHLRLQAFATSLTDLTLAVWALRI
jgi:hypothetical protein